MGFPTDHATRRRMLQVSVESGTGMVDLRQMLLTHYDGVHEGDFDKALSVFTEDVERTMAGAGILHGLDAFRAVIRVFPDAFPEIEFEVHRWIEAGDWPVVEGRVQGTHTGPLRTPEGETPATGKSMSCRHVATSFVGSTSTSTVSR